MISDILSDARAGIQEWLDAADSPYSSTCTDIKWLLERMKEMQTFLDVPPDLTPQHAPQFVKRFGNTPN